MKFGLIGCGAIGILRASALARDPEQQLVAVCDAEGDRARRFAAQFNAAPETDWRALVARTDIDAVIVSTPPHLHAEMAAGAFEAGKHVLCEKPLARNVDECRAMIAAATKAGRFLATGFNYRYYPSIVKAREILDTGVIGKLDHIRSYTGYSAQDHNHTWLHDASIMGGGALRDNGIHLIDLTLYFLGEVADVKGFGSTAVWGFDGCEDNGFALVRSVDGKVATIHASWSEWRGYKLLVELYGERGCIRAWCFPMVTQVVWAETRGGPTRRKTHLFPRVQVMEKLKSYRWVVVESFILEHREFASAARGERASIGTGLDGLHAIEVAERAVHDGEP
jgi:predicted dehydrogenase